MEKATNISYNIIMVVFTILITLLILITLFWFIVGIVFWIIPDVNTIHRNIDGKGVVNSIFSLETMYIYLKTLALLVGVFLIFFTFIYAKIRWELNTYIEPFTLLSNIWSKSDIAVLAKVLAGLPV